MTFPKANRRLPLPVNPSDSRRQKAFRVPFSFLQGQLVGIQSDEPKFNVYRITPGLLPEGFKIVGVWQEHNKESQVFLLVEHPSFDPVPQGQQVPLIEITIDEIDVRRIEAQCDSMVDLGLIPGTPEWDNNVKNELSAQKPDAQKAGFWAKHISPAHKESPLNFDLALASQRLLARQKVRT